MLKMIELIEPTGIGYKRIYPRNIDIIRELQKEIILIPKNREEALKNQQINQKMQKYGYKTI